MSGCSTEDQLRPVEVRLGVTDGTATELLGVPGVATGRPAGSRTRKIAELRQQIAALDDPDARENLERLITSVWRPTR